MKSSSARVGIASNILDLYRTAALGQQQPVSSLSPERLVSATSGRSLLNELPIFDPRNSLINGPFSPMRVDLNVDALLADEDLAD